MKGPFRTCLVLTALLAFFTTGQQLTAGDLYNKEAAHTEAVALPKPADVQALVAYPARINLKGSDDAQQLIITAALGGGGLQDLTGDVQYEVADAQIVRVSSSGRVIPLANGTTQITARYGDKVAQVP